MTHQVIALSERFGHMGSCSGYDGLFRYLAQAQVNGFRTVTHYKEEQKAGLLRRIADRVAGSATKGTPYYSSNSYRAERAALAAARAQRQEIFHNGYLENNYGLPEAYKKLPGLRVVATAHQPSSWWKRSGADPSIVHSLDALIVLDQYSYAYFADYLSPDRIHLIRHGVDTHFFCPSPSATDDDRLHCLFTGQWLRDMELLNAIIRQVAAVSNRVQFHLVGSTATPGLADITSYPSVHFYSALSDEALRERYRQSDLFLAPLIDSTANNGVLEALACGLPVFTNGRGGVLDYLPADASALGAGAEELAAAILRCIDKKPELAAMGIRARQYAVHHLSWEVIGRQVTDLYHQLIRD